MRYTNPRLLYFTLLSSFAQAWHTGTCLRPLHIFALKCCHFIMFYDWLLVNIGYDQNGPGISDMEYNGTLGHDFFVYTKRGAQ